MGQGNQQEAKGAAKSAEALAQSAAIKKLGPKAPTKSKQRTKKCHLLLGAQSPKAPTTRKQTTRKYSVLSWADSWTHANNEAFRTDITTAIGTQQVKV